MKKPIIELSVVNGTDKAVSRVFFEGVVASPGRSVPWVEDTFNYSIPGGIEPGESADWALAPNMFSAWATEVPADAILTLKAYKLEGPGYELPEKSFSDNDKERLDTLKSRYPEYKEFVRAEPHLNVLRPPGEVRRLPDDLFPLNPCFFSSFHQPALEPYLLPVPAGGQAGAVGVHGVDGHGVAPRPGQQALEARPRVHGCH